MEKEREQKKEIIIISYKIGVLIYNQNGNHNFILNIDTKLHEHFYENNHKIWT